MKDAERAMEPYRKVYEREAAWRVRKTMERSAAALQTLCSTEKRIPGAYSVRMRRSRQRKSF